MRSGSIIIKLSIFISGKDPKDRKIIVDHIIQYYLKYKNIPSCTELAPYGIKIYDEYFAIRKTCEQMFGISEPDSEEKIGTHIRWENMPNDTRERYSKKRKGASGKKLAFGNMNSDDLITVFGKEICEKIDENCWSRSLLQFIEQDNNIKLAIVDGINNKTAVPLFVENGGKAIHLLKKNAEVDDITNSDELPYGEYSLVLDHKTVKDGIFKTLDNNLFFWIKYSGI